MSPQLVLHILQLVAQQLSGGQQHSLLLACQGLDVYGLVQPDPHHLRDPACIVAVALVHLLSFQHRLHVTGLHAYRWQPGLS
jgi:hypothetical protein